MNLIQTIFDFKETIELVNQTQGVSFNFEELLISLIKEKIDVYRKFLASNKSLRDLSAGGENVF